MNTLPNKNHFRVSQLAFYASKCHALPLNTAKSRLYRAIKRGDVCAVRKDGVIMIPRQEAIKAIEGVKV